MPANRILSAATVTTIGLACKAFFSLGFCSSVTVTGLHHLLEALDSEERNMGRGIVTVGNHISVLDDPLTWGVLPAHTYLNSRSTRWALGASDIMFTNPAFSMFFRLGQVLETFRGRGIYQPAVDTAIAELNRGAWVHLFGEGKVNQPDTYPVQDGVARLPRFKWGTGRIIMETQRLPVVIPMWLTGFDTIMPEPRGFPRFLPRLGKRVGVAFGAPLPPASLSDILHRWRQSVQPEGGADDVPLGEEDAEKHAARSALTVVVQREVEALGRSVSGSLLGKKLP